MHKGYHFKHHHRPKLGYVLIGIALLWLVGLKGLLFPLFFFGAIWFFFSQAGCGWRNHWGDQPAEKAKNDDNDWDGEYI